jgi:hypothetical protein
MLKERLTKVAKPVKPLEVDLDADFADLFREEN